MNSKWYGFYCAVLSKYHAVVALMENICNNCEELTCIGMVEASLTVVRMPMVEWP